MRRLYRKRRERQSRRGMGREEERGVQCMKTRLDPGQMIDRSEVEVFRIRRLHPANTDILLSDT